MRTGTKSGKGGGTSRRSRGQIRRCVRLVERYPCGKFGFTMKSRSRPNDVWHIVIDPSGTHQCDCEAGRFKPGKPCAHVKRAWESLARRGLIHRPLAGEACSVCGHGPPEYGMADERGEPLWDSWICSACVEFGRNGGR